MLSSNEERSEYTMETRRVHHGNIMDNTASWNTRYYRIYYGIESHHGIEIASYNKNPYAFVS